MLGIDVEALMIVAHRSQEGIVTEIQAIGQPEIRALHAILGEKLDN
jgi:hypothetical protein